MIIDDVESQARRGNELAKILSAQWEYPVEFVFVTPDGKVVSKLNSFKDFPGMHADVAAPPGRQHWALQDEHSHTEHFLSHVARHFGKE